ncbi:MAG: tRNA (guanosine(46)-N7)-methyltransferase TrmB [Bacteroidales bacterium]|nr:tRNA (guanosine(46)-N7)-methyltransferase TrmB [Bacteroidales bacterium]
MGHGKLKKFAENETFRCLLQPDASAVLAPKEPGSRALVLRDHPIKGNWGREMFGNDHPIVLELGCGKGDYTIALARRHPEINYIGVDIKGARLWSGAKQATLEAMPNVAFLRTRIEFIGAFFGPSEVSEIWLTFSDPQLRGSENARLSSPMFLDRYRGFLRSGGIVHLKTDSRYLYEYTQAVCKVNDLQVLANSVNVYKDGIQCVGHKAPAGARPYPGLCGSKVVEGEKAAGDSRGQSPLKFSEGGHGFGNTYPILEEVTSVQTFYEKMFLEMGLPITYMAFQIDHTGPYVAPGEAFDHEKWLEAEGPRRSFGHQPAPRVHGGDKKDPK